jgi:hypothetical protein
LRRYRLHTNVQACRAAAKRFARFMNSHGKQLFFYLAAVVFGRDAA